MFLECDISVVIPLHIPRQDSENQKSVKDDKLASKRTLEQSEILFFNKVQLSTQVSQQTLDPKSLECFHQLNLETGSSMRISPSKTLSKVRNQTQVTQLVSQKILERYRQHQFLIVYLLQEDNPKGPHGEPEPTLTVRSHSSLMTPINYSTSLGDNYNNSLPTNISYYKPDEQNQNPTDPNRD